MTNRMSRRKALGAIGGGMLLTGCISDTSDKEEPQTQRKSSPSGIQYRGIHESTPENWYDVTLVDRVDNAQMCGVRCTMEIYCNYHESTVGEIEATLYLYAGEDLLETRDHYIGKVSGGEREIIEFNANEKKLCQKNIDGFKLATHDYNW